MQEVPSRGNPSKLLSCSSQLTAEGGGVGVRILCMTLNNLLSDLWWKSLSKRRRPLFTNLSDRQLAATNSHWKLPPCHKSLGALNHFFYFYFLSWQPLESRPAHVTQPKHTRKTTEETAAPALVPAKSPVPPVILRLMLPFTDCCIVHFTGM